ncbi:MAG: hypothetical protein AVDCRST_MAG55-809, partial [uncultured Rubrobacteraceae bacterium]
ARRGDAGGGLNLAVPGRGGRWLTVSQNLLRPLQCLRRRCRLRGTEGPEEIRKDRAKAARTFTAM